MLIVAADDGVMPQTIEHLHIVDLLCVQQGVAVITKTDRCPASRVAEVERDIKNLLALTALCSLPTIPVSAVSGEGVERLRGELAAAARAYARQEQAGRHFRCAIDRVFTVAGSGTVVTGTVFNGTVKVGDRLILSPSGVEVRVRALQQHGKSVQQVSAGERCALNLTGVELAQISRGDWALASAIHAPTQRIDARLQVLGSETEALKHWTPVHLHLGTTDVTARVAIRRGATIEPGASEPVQIIADRPLAALHGDRFIVRDQSATRTIGGGSVVDPFAPPTRRNSAARRARLAALECDTAEAALAQLLACSPAGVDVAQIGRTFNLVLERVETLARELGAAIIGKTQRVALPQTTAASIKQRMIEALTRFHRESPQAEGAEIETQHRALAPALAAATFLALLRELADEKKLEVAGSTVRLPRHATTANPVDEKMWQTIKPVLDSAGFRVPALRDLTVATHMKEAQLKDFLYRKSRKGELVRVGNDRFYPRATLGQLAALAQSVARTAPGGKFTAAQFRDASGVGRSLSIEILECFDRLGITQRIGDLRKIYKDYVPLLGPAPAAGPSQTKPAA
jgi:selenocysteine-specific elongation factor